MDICSHLVMQDVFQSGLVYVFFSIPGRGMLGIFLFGIVIRNSSTACALSCFVCVACNEFAVAYTKDDQEDFWWLHF